MILRRSLTLASLVAACFGPWLCAQADPLVFSLDHTANPVGFAAGTQVDQAVTVSEDLTISGFAFYLGQRVDGDVNYFIYDETTATETLGPDLVSVPFSPKAWISLDGLAVALVAGDVYDFGVYGDNFMTVGLDPTASFFSDGLGVAANEPAASQVGLRLFSTDPPSLSPEPSSLILLGTGILAAAGVVRRRLAL